MIPAYDEKSSMIPMFVSRFPSHAIFISRRVRVVPRRRISLNHVLVSKTSTYDLVLVFTKTSMASKHEAFQDNRSWYYRRRSIEILVGLAEAEGCADGATHPPAGELQLSDRLRHDSSTTDEMKYSKCFVWVIVATSLS